MNRTHNNGELRIEQVGQIVELKGWVAKTRNLGGLIFIDLRDRYGMTQLVVNPETAKPEVLCWIMAAMAFMGRGSSEVRAMVTSS